MAIHHLALAPCGFFTNASPAAVQFAAAHMQLVHLKRRYYYVKDKGTQAKEKGNV